MGGVKGSDEIGHGDFAAARVGDAGDGCLFDAGLFGQELFDFAGVDVEATRDNEIAATALEGVISIGGADGDIAGLEPASGSEQMGFTPVAGEEVGAAKEEFADLAVSRDFAGGVAILDDHAGERQADGAGAAFAVERVREVHERFTHAVAFEDGVAVEGFEIFEDLGGQWGGAGDEQAHAIADGAGDGGRPIEHADIHGGHAEEDRRGERLHPGGGLVMGEAFREAEEAAAGEPGVDAVTKAVDVEEGQGEQQTVGGGDPPARDDIEGVGEEVVMGEDGAFRGTGGAGGIDNGGGGFAVRHGYAAGGGIGIDGAAEIFEEEDRRGRGNVGEEILRGDEGSRFGVGEDVTDFAITVEDVDGDEDDAEASGAKIEVNELEAVGEEDAEAVSERETTVGEKVGHAPSPIIDLAEGVEPVPFERWFEATANEREVEQVRQSHGAATKSPAEDRPKAEVSDDARGFATRAWVWP